MQLFNRYVSPRGLTVFGCEIMLIFGSVAVAARAHGVAADVPGDVWKIALVTGCAAGIGYAIRLPANPVLQERIAHLLTRPVGRPPSERTLTGCVPCGGDGGL